MKIVSYSPFGYEGELVTVEVDLRRGIPAVDLVGLADNAIKEARERMRAAIRNSGFEFPMDRVLISLAPADVKKEGSGFDLAIALAVLRAQFQKNGSDSPPPEDDSPTILVMGELELSGKIRPVRGINAAVASAANLGVNHCIVAKQNEEEAGGLNLMNVHAVDNLQEAFDTMLKIPSLEAENSDAIKSNAALNSFLRNDNSVQFPEVDVDSDFSEIVGQPFLVRGLQIAAAGFHNLIAYGPPGCGKSLALQRFPSLVPYLTIDEAQPVTRIYSLAGAMPVGVPLIKKAPFRMPHQSASLQGIIGGGTNCQPGEISLAHNGALFLDEAAEFRTTVLQSLRVPLENGAVTLSRAGRHTIYPASFQLLIATNPCPCGNFGSPDKICVCSAKSVDLYWKKFSSPLLDRVDIRVPVFSASENVIKKNSKTDKEKTGSTKSSAELRKEIAVAVQIQRERQKKRNALLSPEEIQYFCPLDEECHNFLAEQSQKYGFSARAVHSCIKVARTIADMAGVFSIRIEDLQEAIQYRKNEGGIDIMF